MHKTCSMPRNTMGARRLGGCADACITHAVWWGLAAGASTALVTPMALHSGFRVSGVGVLSCQGRDDARCRLPDFGDLDAIVARGDVSSSADDVAPGDRMARGQTVAARSALRAFLLARPGLPESACLTRMQQMNPHCMCPSLYRNSETGVGGHGPGAGQAVSRLVYVCGWHEASNSIKGRAR